MQTFKLKLIVKSVKAQTQKRSCLGARLKQTCILKFFYVDENAHLNSCIKMQNFDLNQLKFLLMKVFI